MSAEKQLTLILANANRLIRDAELLAQHRRYASAFALAVLGLEEVGKALLKYWESDGLWKDAPLPKKELSLHMRKQSAVACMMIGGKIVRKFPKGPDWATLDTAALTDEFNASDAGQAFAAIRNRDLDRRKQNALYQDDGLLTAVEDDFAAAHVESLFTILGAVHQASTDIVAHKAGRELYRLT